MELQEIIRQQDIVLEQMAARTAEIKVLVDDTINDTIDHSSASLNKLMDFFPTPKAATAIKEAELRHLQEQRKLREQEALSPDKRNDLDNTDGKDDHQDEHDKNEPKVASTAKIIIEKSY